MNRIKDEKLLVERMRAKSIEAFVSIYHEYSEDLLILAYSILLDSNQAIRIVNKIFEDLWEEPCELTTDDSLYSFLFDRVRSLCEK